MMLDQSDDKSALTSQSETRSVAIIGSGLIGSCLLYTSDAADDP